MTCSTCVFGSPSEMACHDAIKAVMNAKMKASISIDEHVRKMISFNHEAEINVAVIN